MWRLFCAFFGETHDQTRFSQVSFFNMTQIELLYKHYNDHPKVVTDSRKIEEGSIFFALKGPRFNGNQYAAQAIEKGVETLQALARHHRRQFTIPLIAITGSNGKTTTKELLSVILSSHYPTHFTKGNLNNHIGVPLTLLEMSTDTEVAIIEMGANHVGEIKFLCEIAEPTHGLITNIGKAHLEGFGSIEGVKQGKSELYRFLESSGGMVFINHDERYLQDLALSNPYKVFYKESQHPDANCQDLETKLISSRPYVVAGFRDTEALVEVHSNLTGDYNFNNIMTGISLGRYFKVPAEKIKTAIEGYIPANNRSQLLKVDSNTFLMDAYNANPDSMHKALDNFAKAKETKKIVILGDMLELGEYSDSEHREILKFADSLSLNQILTVGAEFGKVNFHSDRIRHFENVDLLKEWFNTQSFTETYFLLKGSRGIRLEKLVVN